MRYPAVGVLPGQQLASCATCKASYWPRRQFPARWFGPQLVKNLVHAERSEPER